MDWQATIYGAVVCALTIHREWEKLATMNFEWRKIYINYTLFCIDIAEVSKRPHKSTPSTCFNSLHWNISLTFTLNIFCSQVVSVHVALNKTTIATAAAAATVTAMAADVADVVAAAVAVFLWAYTCFQSIVTYKFISTIFSFWNVKYFCILFALLLLLLKGINGL